MYLTKQEQVYLDRLEIDLTAASTITDWQNSTNFALLDAQYLMTEAIQIGNYSIEASEVVPLLAKYQMLPILLRELILEDAIASIDCTAEEVVQAQRQFYTEHRFTQETDVKAWLEYHGLTPEQLIAIATRKLKIEKFKQATWGNKLEAYFLECKGKLDKVTYSLLRTQDIGVVQELFFRIQANEQSFAELAREFSSGPEAQTNGLVGPVELDALHPTIMQSLSSSQPGQLLPPTRINEWFVVMRLEKFIPAQLDEITRVRLLNELFETWLKRRIQEVQREDKKEVVEKVKYGSIPILQKVRM